MTTVTSVFTKQKGPQWHGHPASRALGFPNLQGWAPGLHLNLSVQQRRQPQCLSQNAMVCETGTEPWQPECSPQGSQTPLRLEKNLCLSGMRWPSRVQYLRGPPGHILHINRVVLPAALAPKQEEVRGDKKETLSWG